MDARKVLTIRQAREELPRTLILFRQEGELAEPVLIGPHRRPTGVLMAAKLYERVAGSTAALRTLNITNGRKELSAALQEFDEAGADAEPVVLGARGQADGVLLAFAQYLQMADQVDDVLAAPELSARIQQAAAGGRALSTTVDELAEDLGLDLGAIDDAALRRDLPQRTIEEHLTRRDG